MNNFSVIVACAVETRTIGKDGKMPWHLPIDLKYFKARTTDQVIIMGRKTYESIGQPLPNRINIVVTRDKSFKLTAPIGVWVYESIEEALSCAETFKEKETIVIGGGEIYRQVMEMDPFRLYVTWVGYKADGLIEGDTYFPLIDNNQFDIIDEYNIDQNEFNLNFTTYERKKDGNS